MPFRCEDAIAISNTAAMMTANDNEMTVTTPTVITTNHEEEKQETEENEETETEHGDRLYDSNPSAAEATAAAAVERRENGCCLRSQRGKRRRRREEEEYIRNNHFHCGWRWSWSWMSQWIQQSYYNLHNNNNNLHHPKLLHELLLRDAIAGCTVAVMVIPQSMSYAKLAGLPVQYGLYGALGPLFMYALVGNRRHVLSIGPVAITSLLLNAGIAQVLNEAGIKIGIDNNHEEDRTLLYVHMAIQTSLGVGVLYAIMAILRLESILPRLLSHTVISGFSSGSSIIIALSQVKYVLGYDNTFPRADSVLEILRNLWMFAGQFQLAPFLIGTSSLLLLQFLKHMGNRTTTGSCSNSSRSSWSCWNWSTTWSRMGLCLRRYCGRINKRRVHSAPHPLSNPHVPSPHHHHPSYRWLLKCIGPLLVTVLGIGLASATTSTRRLHQIPVVGAIPQGWPPWSIHMVYTVPPPLLQLSPYPYGWSLLMRVILPVAMVGLMESMAIAQQLRNKNKNNKKDHPNVKNSRSDTGAELLWGLGLANVAGSLWSAYPVAGSFSRSAINHESGAISQVSSMITSIMVAFVVVYMTRVFEKLPLASLAAIIISGVSSLLDVEEAVRLWSNHFVCDDWLVWMVTFVGVCGWGAEVGLLSGILVSFVIASVPLLIPFLCKTTILTTPTTHRLCCLNNPIIIEQPLLLQEEGECAAPAPPPGNGIIVSSIPTASVSFLTQHWVVEKLLQSLSDAIMLQHATQHHDPRVNGTTTPPPPPSSPSSSSPLRKRLHPDHSSYLAHSNHSNSNYYWVLDGSRVRHVDASGVHAFEALPILAHTTLVTALEAAEALKAAAAEAAAAAGTTGICIPSSLSSLRQPSFNNTIIWICTAQAHPRVQQRLMGVSLTQPQHREINYHHDDHDSDHHDSDDRNRDYDHDDEANVESEPSSCGGFKFFPSVDAAVRWCVMSSSRMRQEAHQDEDEAVATMVEEEIETVTVPTSVLLSDSL